MQKITTQEWTLITGLDSSKTYILQAQLDTEQKVIPVNWYQGESIPTTNDRQILCGSIKVNATKNVYVRTQATPIIIVNQEVIE